MCACKAVYEIKAVKNCETQMHYALESFWSEDRNTEKKIHVSLLKVVVKKNVFLFKESFYPCTMYRGS